MPSIELYINHQLCEIDNPENFSVYLKRQLLNPAELSTKDAQRSYDITLPATAANNHIFGYTNIEEVKGKFSQLYDAQLLVNGVKIFDGKFKISEITQDSYKGNLGVPAQKSVKDIFGETMMNQAGKWLIPFKDQTSITEYNEKENPECFFPLVLYGLLPKEPINGTTDKYTSKGLFDEYVALGLDNIPPSINCVEAIKQIFNNSKPAYTISGSAFDDELLNKIYVSYKNPVSYKLPWNYADYGKIDIDVAWSNGISLLAKVPLEDYRHYRAETAFSKNPSSDGSIVFACNLNTAINSSFNVNKDDTGSVVSIPSGLRGSHGTTTIKVPYTGIYKLILKANIGLGKAPVSQSFNDLGVSITPANSAYNFKSRRTEIKLFRKPAGEKIDLTKVGSDNSFYQKNQKQTLSGNDVKKFPGADEVNLIDPAQNDALVCGFSFGYNPGDLEAQNPLDTEKLYCNPMAVSGGDTIFSNLIDSPLRSYSAVNSKVYFTSHYDELTKKTTYTRSDDAYNVRLENTPFDTNAALSDDYNATGTICQLIYLQEGEELSFVSTADVSYFYNNQPGWLYQGVRLNLVLEPFITDYKWLGLNDEGETKKVLNWNSAGDIYADHINLINFMPADIKVDDWISNFCKAFNLNLIQTGSTHFELNAKRTGMTDKWTVIDLDNRTDVNISRKNSSLSLPSLYEIGFTVDTNEEGYFESEDNGGGKFETDSIENKKINQTSSFSYNWFKAIEKTDNEDTLLLPVISDKEAWGVGTSNYAEMLAKDYMNKSQRFWYKLPSQNNFTAQVMNHKKVKKEVSLARVSNIYKDSQTSMVLNYRERNRIDSDQRENSILDNYFILMSDTDNCYTTVECYLSPDEYNKAPASWIKLNSDLYYIAEIDGYDPAGKKKTTLKLIRRLL